MTTINTGLLLSPASTSLFVEFLGNLIHAPAWPESTNKISYANLVPV